MKKILLSIIFANLFVSMTVVAGANDALNEALAAQPEEVQARYVYRHSKETLEFFGIKPGMTVVEGLPGGGWYTKILLPFLGAEGTLIGADYAQDMYPKFGFFDQEALDKKKTWVSDWTAKANGWRSKDDAKIKAFQFGSLPDEMKGTADAVFLVRALHNLARFENDGGYLTAALNDAFEALKPGGVAGVVQHEARDDKSDAWADGSRGYLKQSFVIDRMEKAGFVFEGSIDINNNPADQPGDSDIVWRLPPTYHTSRENPELKAQMQAVGESNRMTLRFRKPEK
jgi:predicted methyltransferase